MSDRSNWYFRQLVTWAEMRLADDDLEIADRAIISDIDPLWGVDLLNPFIVKEAAVPDLTVDVQDGLGYDDDGKRIDHIGVTTNVDCSQDYLGASTTPGVGQVRGLSVYALFDTVESDPRIDGDGIPLNYRVEEAYAFEVRQGADVPAPGPPTYPGVFPGRLKIAEILRTAGDVTINNAEIDNETNQEYGGPHRYRAQTFCEPIRFPACCGSSSTTAGIQDFEFAPAAGVVTANKLTADGVLAQLRFNLDKLPELKENPDITRSYITRVYVSGVQDTTGAGGDISVTLYASIGGASAPLGVWTTGLAPLGVPTGFVIDTDVIGAIAVPLQHIVGPVVFQNYFVEVECPNNAVAGDVIYECFVEVTTVLVQS